MNNRLDTNSFVFPILKDGFITFNKDVYLKTNISGRIDFSETDQKAEQDNRFGEVKFTRVLKGETYPVTGIHIDHQDGGTAIVLETPIGRIPETINIMERNISTNKNIRSEFFSHLGDLMAYPLIILIILSKVISFLGYIFPVKA